MSCYKFLYLYFKNSQRPKYAYGSLETWCQANYLLSERYASDLVWNRFVNNQGKSDTNMPVDLDVEHLNKPLKTDLKTYRGDITDPSVQRLSRTVEDTEKIVRNFDKQNDVKRPSGTHRAASFDDDINILVQYMNEKKVFGHIPGRQHTHIRKISADVLATLDMKDIHAWLKSCISGFCNKHYYK